MHFDVMTGPRSWADAAALARHAHAAGFSGMLWTETSQVPWMQMTAASLAAPELHYSTGIAVAFPRSPMISASIAWEMAANTKGRFRLGLGSQVKAHITRRYGSDFDRPAARMRDHVLAVRACWRAFAREERLAHDGDFHQLSLLPPDWTPPPHDHPMRVDISAVGPLMTRVAGEVADGVHVHPLHSVHYLDNRLRPALEDGAIAAGRDPDDIDLLIPAFICPGDTHEDRRRYVEYARRQIAFYGSTPNYAFQFDDLGFEGTTGRVRERMKAGDLATIGDLITDDMLDHFAVVGTWQQVADTLIERYAGRASRLITYIGGDDIMSNEPLRNRWAELAEAVRAA